MTTPDPQATPFQPEDAAQVPAPEAPAFPQASTPGYDEATATPGSTTYGTAYDAQQGYGVPGPDANEQAAYAAGQQAYGQPAYGQPFAAGAPKQWIVAVILAFFLGTLGVHNFYLGYTTKGIIQLVLTLTFIGLIVSGIWAFIDFIMLLMRSGDYATDAQGQPLQ